MIDTQTKNIYKVCKWDVMYFKQLTMTFNNFVASCNVYCVVYRPICWHRSRCHADNRASSTNARDSARCSQTGVFRVHLEDDIMDDTRLIVEVEKHELTNE